LADRFVRRDPSLDYSPAVLRMPFGFHLTVDTLPSGCLPDRTYDVGIPLSVSAVSDFVPL